jgi:N-acyl-D-amino-acid deacylase
MVGTDAILVGASPHPRATGTYPTVLGRYVREEGIVTLERAVRAMTGGPAARLGLGDRGRIEPGLAADLVLFDPGRVGSPATYEHPLASPVGMPYVFVNGQPVKWDDQPTGERAGVVLRRGLTGSAR